MMLSDYPVLTLQQKLRASPYRLVHRQLVIPAELLVQLPGSLPPSMLRIRSLLTLCSPHSGAFRKPGCGVHWYSDHLNDFQRNCVPIVRSKCAISQNRTCTYYPEPFHGLGVLQGPSIPAPRHTTFEYFFDIGSASCAVVLCLGGALSSDAEQSFSYMRNMRTVKVTYWGRIFFCRCLYFFGVSRCLGYPSGGVCRWWSHVWGGRGRQIRWSRLRVCVLI